MDCKCNEKGNEYVSREGLICLLELLKEIVDKNIVEAIKDEIAQGVILSNQDILRRINDMLVNGYLVSKDDLDDTKDIIYDKIASTKADLKVVASEIVNEKLEEKIGGADVLSTEVADAKYVDVAGDTMTGPLNVPVLVLSNGEDQIELFF